MPATTISASPFSNACGCVPADYLARARDLQARGAGGEMRGLLQEVLATATANLRETFEAKNEARFIACAEALTKVSGASMWSVNAQLFSGSYCQKLCMGLSCGGAILAFSIDEFDASNDLGELI